jgi:DNA polymerase-3 subunit delta'
MSVFDGLPAQPDAARRLELALAAPGHAYLFEGPPGSAKRRYAERFCAALIGCELRRVEQRIHPDLFAIEPEGQTILVDEVRRMRRDLHMRPFEAQRRVYLLLDCHLLRDESANALLKSLEEPPSYVVFVLVTDRPRRLLPTIRSRVAPVRFHRFATAELERLTGDPLATRAARGDLSRAEQLAADTESAGRRSRYLELARDSTAGAAFDPAAAAAEVLACAGARARHEERRLNAERDAVLELVDDARERRALEKRFEERTKRAARRAEWDELRLAVDTVAGWQRDRLAAALGADDLVVDSAASDDASRPGGTRGVGEQIVALEVAADVRRSLELNVHPAIALEAMFHRLARVPEQVAR